jgi:hypothetical protein
MDGNRLHGAGLRSLHHVLAVKRLGNRLGDAVSGET